MRPRGGHVLKFIGDAVLAIFPFEERDEAETCRIALDAAEEALASLSVRGDERRKEGRPFAEVDIALHVGEVLYGNFGAVDRLDFTAIGPAVNEVARLEKLCEPLGRHILMSDRFANAARTPCGARMRSLGTFTLRGVGAPKEVFGCSREVADPVASEGLRSARHAVEITRLAGRERASALVFRRWSSSTAHSDIGS